MTSELCVLRRHKMQEDKIHMWFKYVTVFQGHLYIITSYTQHEGCTLYIYIYMVQNTVTYLVMYGLYYKYREHSSCGSQEDVNEE